MKKIFKKIILTILLGNYVSYNMHTFINNKNLSIINKSSFSERKLANNRPNIEETSTSYVDNYVPQNNLNLELEAEIESDNYELSLLSGDQYTDNEHKDDKPSGATKINYQDGYITGKLNVNDGWTQFWNNVGERDEDYYRFTLPEKLKIYFLYYGPKNYNMRILDYSLNFVCTSQSQITIELNPGTYYLHVYTNDKENITDQEYSIDYFCSRYSNTTNFLINDSTKSKYKMAIWENEVFPKNGVRYIKKEQTLKYRMTPRRGSIVNSGYVDPLYYIDEENQTLTDCVYLDSILYLWGKEEIKEIYTNINEMYVKTMKAIKEENAKDLIIEFVEDVNSTILSIVGFFPLVGTTASIFSTTLSSRSLMLSVYKCFFGPQKISDNQMWYTLGTINGILYSALNSSNDIVVKIPKYYFFKKVNGNVGDNSLKTTSWKLITTIFKGEFEKAETYVCSDTEINCSQNFNGKTYHGNIIAFENKQKYADFIEGNESGISLGNHTIHEYNNIKDCDNDKHILFCDCGYQKFENHKNFYDSRSGDFSCEYCKHKFSLNTNSISQSKYGYNNEYNLEPLEEYIMGDDGKSILTKRLRCAYINNYLVMSSKSNDANQAYLEYDFDYQVVEFNYNLALWSDDESLIRKSSISLEYYNDGWKVKRVFNPKEMSTNKDELINYIDTFEIGATKIRFVVRTNYVENANNRGRVVIGNVEYKYGV